MLGIIIDFIFKANQKNIKTKGMLMCRFFINRSLFFPEHIVNNIIQKLSK